MVRTSLFSAVAIGCVFIVGCGQEEQAVPQTPVAAPPAVPASLPQAAAPAATAPTPTAPTAVATAPTPEALPATPIAAEPAPETGDTPSDTKETPTKTGNSQGKKDEKNETGTPDIEKIIENPPEDALKDVKGEVKQRSAKNLTGSLSSKDVNLVIRKKASEIKACGTLAFKAKPKTEGLLEINVTVNAAGKVTKTATTKNDIGNVGEKCLTKHLKGLKFPESSGETTFLKVYEFSPGA